MVIFSWLFAQTPSIDSPAPPIKPTPEALKIGIEITLGDINSEAAPEQIDAPASSGDRRFTLEPYFWMIEYTDANGITTRRRVTMRSIDDRSGTSYLNAICHERNALRTFRLDRISNLISQDGEVEPAAPWFAEVMGSSEIVAMKPRADRATQAATPYTTLRREITPALTILTAAARSDDILHPRELDRILRYAEDQAIELRQAGILKSMPEGEDFDKLDRTIRRLRPTTDDLTLAIEALGGWSAARKRALALALAETAAADGTIDEIEASVIEDLCSFGTRQHGFGWSE